MSPSEKRNAQIIKSAEALLPERVHGEEHNFILSRNEAVAVGEAVASRDHRSLRLVLAEAIAQLEDHYDSFTIDDLRGEWESAVRDGTGLDGDLLDFLTDKSKSLALDKLLVDDTGREGQILSPISQIKLLETIIYATAPEGLDSFNSCHATARRFRKDRGNLYNRSLNLLEGMCERDPGVRRIREGLLDGDDSALDGYLGDVSRFYVARQAYAGIIETFQEGRADAMRRSVRQQLASSEAFNEVLSTHILQWEMLPREITDSPNPNGKIRAIVRDRAKNKLDVDEHWRDERIDVLFDTASLATKLGREAGIYISSTFDGGNGLYLAVVLSHPLDATKQIAIADNPLKGNALYIADEMLTEYDDSGQQYTWREVLGGVRRLARARGARRKYHTGNWADLPAVVCELGGDARVVREKRRQHEEAIRAAAGEVLDIRAALDGLQIALDAARAQSAAMSIE